MIDRIPLTVLVLATVLLTANTLIGVARDFGAVFPWIEKHRTPYTEPAVTTPLQFVIAFTVSVIVFGSQWMVLLYVWWHR